MITKNVSCALLHTWQYYWAVGVVLAFKNLSAALGVGVWFELLTISPSDPLLSAGWCSGHHSLMPCTHACLPLPRWLLCQSGPSCSSEAYLKAVASYFHWSRTHTGIHNAFCAACCVLVVLWERVPSDQKLTFSSACCLSLRLHMKIELSR